MKIFKKDDLVHLIILLLNGLVFFILWLILNGCSLNKDNLQPTSSKVQIVEKVVPVACPIEKVECDFTGKDFVPTKKLLECVILQKRIIEQCSKPIE